jgi:hypothetical protein
MDKQNPDEMKRCAAVMAVHAFCVADLEDPLPRMQDHSK